MASIVIDSNILIAQIINFVLLFVLIGLLIWLMIRFFSRTKRHPLNIARSRYSKGKITLEELRRITKELGGD
jgi:uncharacterized membrane protein